MRGPDERYFPSEIKALPEHKRGANAQMAFVHHELCTENAVIPFSLSLPVSRTKASLASLRWSFPPR